MEAWNNLTMVEFILITNGFSYEAIESMPPVERNRYYELLQQKNEEEKKLLEKSKEKMKSSPKPIRKR